MALGFTRFLKLFLRPGSLSANEAGALEVNSSDNKLNYHNGSSQSPLVTESHAATLTNKSIDADQNTITNIENADIKAGAGIEYSKLELTDSIVDADINSAAAIDRTKLESGSANHVLINDSGGVMSSEATLSPSRGGTGIANNPASTLTLSGSNPITLTTTGPTSLSLPTSGTLVTAENGVFTSDVTIAEIASPSTPASGFMKIYAKSDGKFYFKNDAGAETQVNSGVGGINYITNPDAESGTTGWATYADAASSRPENGTGGSPNITLTASPTNPLRGSQSFLITKDAANRQGQGVSFDFTVDRADMQKVLSVQFDYEPGSGFTAGSDTADSDLIVYLYDVTNGALIEPTPFRLLTGAGFEGKFASTFQTNSNSTSYRLIIHIATTSATAWTFKFDNVSIGPQEIIEGVPVTDWNNNLIFTTTGFGTPTSTDFRWRRVGDSMEVYGKLVAGTTTATAASVVLPTGYSIDASKFASTSQEIVGNAEQLSSTTQNQNTATSGRVSLFYDGSTTSSVFFGRQTQTQAFLKANGNDMAGSGEGTSFRFTIPILGWSTPVQLSADQDNRVVAASYYLSSTTTFNNTPINLDTRLYDTHGAVTTGASWKFTAPISGYYTVTRTSLVSPAANNVEKLFINGVELVNVVSNNMNDQTVSGSVTVKLNAGDYIDLRPNGSSQFSGGVAPIRNAIYIEKVSGNSFIVPSETVAARYYLENVPSYNISSGAPVGPVDFNTKDFDTHNAVTTGASWKFTAPISGIYHVESEVSFSANTTGFRIVLISVNGTFVTEALMGASQSDKTTPQSSTLVKLNAGDYVDIFVQQNSGSTLTLIDQARNTHISIHRI